MSAGLLLLALVGCVHRIEVTSIPAGAAVQFNGVAVTSVPAEVEVRPFKPHEIEVSLPGYRPATMRLSRTGAMSFVGDAVTLRWGRALGLAPYRSVEVRLIREHGGIGTWDPDTIER